MFRGMENVYAVWKERSFSAAAKKLYITQPALSNSIKRVEDKIGAPLFDRSSSPIQLTETGREYIHAVEQIMAVQENFERYLSDAHNLRAGRLTIGSGAMLSSYILPRLIHDYKVRFPYVKVDVVECGVDELQRRLMDGVIDLAIENSAFPETLFECQFFRKENMILAVPGHWEINRELLPWRQSIENIASGEYLRERYPAVPLEKFADLPFILLKPDDECHSRVMAICRSYRFTPKPILTLNQQLTSYNMACAGVGAVFVSDTLVKSAPPNPNICYYKIKGDMVERDICFYYKKNRYMPRCAEQFLKDAAALVQPETAPDDLAAVGDD